MKPLGQSREAKFSAHELQAAIRAPREIYRQHFAPLAPRHGFVREEPSIHGVLTTARRNAGRATYSGTPAGR